ncbi:SDR family NAD(P)-dependent oxidoreductase [Lichenicoccus sp.]|uniref:SDR family NAD(P)-dependent oxidoreductase n=1 Tax=Lichenicoccus sp. TaxID=2781899 RepID=UPI003D13AE11
MAQQEIQATEQRYSSIAGRSAIVTGGGRGLGRVMALALIQQGGNVMITGARAAGELGETEAAANALGAGRCVSMVADVSDPDACERVTRAAEAAFGSVDILINNAARGPVEQFDEIGRLAHLKQGLPTAPQLKHSSQGDRFWEADVQGYLRMLLTNLGGPFLMTRACIPSMIGRGFGRIVNISTSRPTLVHTGFGPYGPLKAALEASSRIWAAELEGTGVTVNVLLPGGASDTAAIPGPGVGTRAPPFRAGEAPRGTEAYQKGLLPPAIMAPPLLWLASDESNGVTGRRFSARDWSDSILPAEAARYAESDRIEVPHII